VWAAIKRSPSRNASGSERLDSGRSKLTLKTASHGSISQTPTTAPEVAQPADPPPKNSESGFIATAAKVPITDAADR